MIVNFYGTSICSRGFPGSVNGKESAYNARDPIQSLGVEDPLEKGMATYFSNLA